jgi:hypothetical protein
VSAGTDSGLREHLIGARLAGDVATSPHSTLTNCAKLAAGDERYTFGLSGRCTIREAVAAVVTLCGGDPPAADPDGDGWIDPDATLRAIAVHRDLLGSFTAAGGGRVLLATGHPTGLLPHYAAIARFLQSRGCLLLAPLDDTRMAVDEASGQRRWLRFLDGVACVSDGGSLRHTHRSRYMEAMLDEVAGNAPDLVVADHGMAGAAIERGLPTLSIADVNDPALPLAQALGLTDAVLPIDDNLAPRLFIPVTAAILSG